MSFQRKLSRMRDRVKKATTTAHDATFDGERAGELIDKLTASGLFDGYGYTEIVTAAINVAARAIHDEVNLPAVKCLQLLGQITGTMAQRETENGLLGASWGDPNAD